MSDILRQAIEAAERHAAGHDDLDRRYIEQLRADPGRLGAARDKDRAYLAMLLDFAGLREDAVWVLRHDPGLSPGHVNPALRNAEGMLAAAHGEYGQAKHLLEAALAAAADAPASLRTAILANLAAISFQTGDIDAAKELADPDHPAAAGGGPAAAMLSASVQGAVAATEDDRRGLDVAAARLESASRSWTVDPGTHDVAALALVAEMAITDSQLASSDGSVVRLKQAAAVLEVTALRLAAELGAGHPQALAAAASFAQTEVDIARAAGSAAELEQAIGQLAVVCERAGSRLGATSPLARRLAESLASAKLARSRAQGSRHGSVPSVGKADLGLLTFVYQGTGGRIFRVAEFRLPGDPAPLYYEEFSADRMAGTRSAREAVAFRAALSPAERIELDRYIAWPRAVVEASSGAECGVLTHIPEEFFSWPEEPGPGQLGARPRELERLSAAGEGPSAGQRDGEEADQTDRLFLLAQLVYAIGWLHKRGWVCGDLNLKNTLFRLDPPRLLLLGSSAAPLADPAGTVTDTYQLGLAILRCLTPGPGQEPAPAGDMSRLTGQLGQDGIDLVGRALSADRGDRPTAKELYVYLRNVLTPRIRVPEITAARIVSPVAVRGQDVRIEWRISKADALTISAGWSQVLEVEPARYPDGYAFRPEGSGPVLIEARNRYGTVTVDLGALDLYELPSFAVDLPPLPRLRFPVIDPVALQTTGQLGASGSAPAPQLPERELTRNPDPHEARRKAGR